MLQLYLVCHGWFPQAELLRVTVPCLRLDILIKKTVNAIAQTRIPAIELVRDQSIPPDLVLTVE